MPGPLVANAAKPARLGAGVAKNAHAQLTSHSPVLPLRKALLCTRGSSPFRGDRTSAP